MVLRNIEVDFRFTDCWMTEYPLWPASLMIQQGAPNNKESTMDEQNYGGTTADQSEDAATPSQPVEDQSASPSEQVSTPAHQVVENLHEEQDQDAAQKSEAPTNEEQQAAEDRRQAELAEQREYHNEQRVSSGDQNPETD